MRTFFWGLCLLSLAACSASRRSMRYFSKTFQPEVETSPVFARSVTGFHLLDAASGRELCAVNADKYFTPASNTKILTLATCLKVLGDSIPGVSYCRYAEKLDTPPYVFTTILFRGTGDPTFLHPQFQAWQPVRNLLASADELDFDRTSMKDARFGPGWSWDDYSDGYAAERASMPVYGNVMHLSRNGDHWKLEPDYFQDSVKVGGFEDAMTPDFSIHRAETSNTVYLPPVFVPRIQNESDLSVDFQLDIPIYRVEQNLLQLILGSLQPVGHKIGGLEILGITQPKQILYSAPVDTVYRRMMQHSDNFIAEQLLLVCSGVKFDSLKQAAIIAWAKDSVFAGLPNPPKWVDGSGLSRYNLISPRFLTALLRRLYLEQPRERLFSLFPAGGVSGTLADWYGGPAGKPFVFAKTGTLSGVHCLSGYLVAKSGKVLIFSFMHNNFLGSSRAWKQEMQRLLSEAYMHY